MSGRFNLLRVALGVVLLATAGLKLYGLGVSAVPRVGWFAQPWVQLLAAEWELILGAWLLSGASPRLAWLAALLTFATFAAVSGYLGWIGVASCGCLGTIKANPWWAFGIDVVALTLLVVVRPRVRNASEERAALVRGLRWVSAGVLLFAGLTTAAAIVYGSPAVALARLRGETLLVDAYLDVGTGKVGDDLEATVTVRNVTDRSIRLVGGTSDCSCTVLRDLPVTIDPGATVTIGIEFHVPSADPGQLTRTVFLRTDDRTQPVVRLTIGCRVE